MSDDKRIIDELLTELKNYLSGHVERIVLESSENLRRSMEILFFYCPHCRGTVNVNVQDTNCCIFRHGIFKNGQQVPPHSRKELCDKLVAMGEINGCGKPFQLVTRNGRDYTVVACGYI